MLAKLGKGGGGSGMKNMLKAAGGTVVKCRKDLRVQALLQEWWELVQADMRSHGASNPTALDEEAYFSIFFKIYIAMVSEYNEEEAQEAVEADWETDSGGTGSIPETNFKSVMFELAQTWTPGSNPAKYVAFLRDLLHAITEVNPANGTRSFREDKSITPGSGQPSLFDTVTDLDDLFDDGADEEDGNNAASASRPPPPKLTAAREQAAKEAAIREKEAMEAAAKRDAAAVTVQRRARGVLARERKVAEAKLKRQIRLEEHQRMRFHRLPESFTAARIEIESFAVDSTSASGNGDPSASPRCDMERPMTAASIGSAASKQHLAAAASVYSARGPGSSTGASPAMPRRAHGSPGKPRAQALINSPHGSPLIRHTSPQVGRITSPKRRPQPNLANLPAAAAPLAPPSFELPPSVTGVELPPPATAMAPSGASPAPFKRPKSPPSPRGAGRPHSPILDTGANAGGCFTRGQTAARTVDGLGLYSTRPATVQLPGPRERAVAKGMATDVTLFPPSRSSQGSSRQPSRPQTSEGGRGTSDPLPRRSRKPAAPAPTRASTAEGGTRSARAAAAAQQRQPTPVAHQQRPASSTAGAPSPSAAAPTAVAVHGFPAAAPTTRALSPRERPIKSFTPREHDMLRDEARIAEDAAAYGITKHPSPRMARMRAQALAVQTANAEKQRLARVKAMEEATSKPGVINQGALAPWGQGVFGRPATADGFVPACCHSSPRFLDQLLVLPPSKGPAKAAKASINHGSDGAATAEAAAASAAAIKWRVSLESVWRAREHGAQPPNTSPRLMQDNAPASARAAMITAMYKPALYPRSMAGPALGGTKHSAADQKILTNGTRRVHPAVGDPSEVAKGLDSFREHIGRQLASRKFDKESSPPPRSAAWLSSGHTSMWKDAAEAPQRARSARRAEEAHSYSARGRTATVNNSYPKGRHYHLPTEEPPLLALPPPS